MKKLLAGTALCLLTTTAFAADLPSRSAPAAVVMAPTSWTGAYFGVFGGGALLNSTFTDHYNNTFNSREPRDVSATGVLGGLTAGYNHQFGKAVIGAEVDYAISNLKNDVQDPTWSPDGSRTAIEWSSIATARARIGYSIDNTLIYATGGAAFVKQKAITSTQLAKTCSEAEAISTANGNGYYCGSSDKWQAGVAIGAGAEVALTRNVSVKADYLYIALPSKTFNDAQGSSYGSYTVKADAHLGRFGVNYKF